MEKPEAETSLWKMVLTYVGIIIFLALVWVFIKNEVLWAPEQNTQEEEEEK
ncbi:MAG: hypothetical protein PHV42_00540 [Candidatus Pacebacteria bacterium]|nr:hypothetical protein [Candidatus Paceibacterota bacterium]